MIVDFRKGRVVFDEIFVGGKVVRSVDCYKYLGPMIHDKLRKTHNR